MYCCTYEMGSTLSLALKGILMDEVTKESQNNLFACGCKHGGISFWKLENFRGIGILVGIDYSPQYEIQNGVER